MSILLFLLSILVCGILCLESADVEIIKDSHGNLHCGFNGVQYQINNPNDFNIELGDAKVSYEIEDSLITLYSYNKKNNTNIILNDYGSDLPLFYKKIKLIIINVQWVDNPDYCLTTETIHRYLSHFNYSLKLTTGSTTTIDLNTTFIVPECVPCNSTCYANYNSMLDYTWKYVVDHYPSQTKTTYSSRIFFTNLPGYNWIGYALVGNTNSWVRNSNYWTIVRDVRTNTSDNRIFTLLHEVGHNMGYGHATKAPSDVGFINTYKIVDGYTDYSNYMGNGGNWWTIPGPTQFRRIVSNNRDYEPWMKRVTIGTNKYRLLAWDHQYTRHYLGVNISKLNDDELIINDIKSTNIRASLEIRYDKNIYSKLEGNSNGTIMLEYHCYETGLESHLNRGIKFTYGEAIDSKGGNILNIYSNILNAAIDDLPTWYASELPLGYIKIPNVDVGTIKIKVLKFNKIKDKNPDPLLLDKIDDNTINKLTIDDIPYVDVEIEYNPNIKYTYPTKQVDKLEIDMSPSLYECNYNDTNDELKCNRFINNQYFWYYIKEGIWRDNNIPRMYQTNNNVYNYRLGVFSDTNTVINEHRIAYGNPDKYKIRITTFKNTYIGDKSNNIIYYSNCKILQKINNSYVLLTNDEIKNISNNINIDEYYDIILYTLKLQTNDNVDITDFYNNKVSFINNNNINNTNFIILNKLPYQGYSDMFFSIRNQTKLKSQYYISRMQSKFIDNRIIIHDYINNSFIIGTNYLTDHFTTTSIVGPLNIEYNKWYYFVFNKFTLNDFILFDFIDIIPSKLILYIETDYGIYEKDLYFMKGLKDTSIRLSIYDISQVTGGWGEIYRYKFNNNVKLISIRPITMTKITNQPKYSKQIINRRIDTIDYQYDCLGMNNTYEFKPYKNIFNDIEYEYITTDTIHTIYYPVFNISYKIYNIFIIILINILIFII